MEVRPKIQDPVILRDLALSQVGIEDAQASVWLHSQDTVNWEIPQLHNSQDMETSYMSTNRGVDKEEVVHS